MPPLLAAWFTSVVRNLSAWLFGSPPLSGTYWLGCLVHLHCQKPIGLAAWFTSIVRNLSAWLLGSPVLSETYRLGCLIHLCCQKPIGFSNETCRHTDTGPADQTCSFPHHSVLMTGQPVLALALTPLCLAPGRVVTRLSAGSSGSHHLVGSEPPGCQLVQVAVTTWWDQNRQAVSWFQWQLPLGGIRTARLSAGSSDSYHLVGLEPPGCQLVPVAVTTWWD